MASAPTTPASFPLWEDRFAKDRIPGCDRVVQCRRYERPATGAICLSAFATCTRCDSGVTSDRSAIHGLRCPGAITAARTAPHDWQHSNWTMPIDCADATATGLATALQKPHFGRGEAIDRVLYSSGRTVQRHEGRASWRCHGCWTAASSPAWERTRAARC